MFGRLQHEIVEHWRRGPVFYRRICRQRHRIDTDIARRNTRLDFHPGDDGRRSCRRRFMGPGVRLSQSQVQRQRDHHHPDDELYRDRVE